jgi:chorismate-pyruvate lyase
MNAGRTNSPQDLRGSMNRAGQWVFVTFGVAALAAPLQAATRWPDTFVARLEALALMETLNASLLASNSATDTLQDWCAGHHMAADATIHAHLLRGVQKPISAAERRRLGIGAHEPVIYRRVDLACGDHILSRADNWYVPGRLTPAIDKALETTDIPFGRAVRALHPRRQTFAVLILWHPLPEGWETAAPVNHPDAELAIPPLLFEHHAVVYAGGKPISEVDESYTSDILDFRTGK